MMMSSALILLRNSSQNWCLKLRKSLTMKCASFSWPPWKSYHKQWEIRIQMRSNSNKIRWKENKLKRTAKQPKKQQVPRKQKYSMMQRKRKQSSSKSKQNLLHRIWCQWRKLAKSIKKKDKEVYGTITLIIGKKNPLLAGPKRLSNAS